MFDVVVVSVGIDVGGARCGVRSRRDDLLSFFISFFSARGWEVDAMRWCGGEEEGRSAGSVDSN